MGEKLPGKSGRSWREIGRRVNWAGVITRRRISILAIALLAGFLTRALLTTGHTSQAIFVPLCVGTYQSASIPTTPFAEQDAAGIARQFPRVTAILGNEAHRFLQTLAGLKHHPDDSVVLYVSAQAMRDSTGAIYVLPADALPDQPDTWLPLRTVLTELRDCPARHKLLILDIMRSLPQPRLGVLADDIAAGIDGELNAVADSNRLVLCACGPGQTTLAAPEMGRSVFGFYVEEGLRGFADSVAGADGRITVRELAAFVRTRVDRWARLNRGVRQTPVLLGGAQDSTLLTVDRRQTHEHVPATQEPAYPQALTSAWKERDHWWDSGAYRLAPRAFQKMQALLQAAEADWLAGIDLARIHRSRLSRLESLQQELAAALKARVADPGDRPAPPANAYAAELFGLHPEVFPWIKDQLVRTAQARHDADVRAFAEGFVAHTEVEQHAHRARELDQKLFHTAKTVDQALALLDEARASLPLFPPYLESMTEANPAWSSAVEDVERLAEALSVQPATDASLALVQQYAQALHAKLAALNRPFLPENLARLQNRASADPGPEAVKEIEALLSIPHPLLKAGERVRLWQTGRQIAHRLYERTRQLDRREDEDDQSPGADVEPAAAVHEYGKRTHVSLGLFRLGGMSSESSEPIRSGWRHAQVNPEVLIGWSPVQEQVRRTWTDVLAAEYQRARTDVERTGLCWIAPALDYISAIDESKPAPAFLVHKERVAAFQAWLAGHYRYLATDLDGLGLSTPAMDAARRVYADAAAAYQPAGTASSLFKIHTPVRAGWLSEKHPTTRVVVEARPLTSGPQKIDVRVVAPDELAVLRETVALPVSRGKRTAAEATVIPLRIGLRPDATSKKAAQPRGILLELAAAGRHYHHIVPVPVLSAGREFRIFLGETPGEPKPVPAISLETGGKRRRFKLYVDNPTDARCPVTIKLNIDEPQEVWLTALKPGVIEAFQFSRAGACSRLSNPITLELLAGEQVLDSRSISLTVAQPERRAAPSCGLELPEVLRAGVKVPLPLRLCNLPLRATVEIAETPREGGEWILLARTPAQEVQINARYSGAEVTFDASLKNNEVFVNLQRYRGRGKLRVRLLDDKDRVLDEVIREVTIRDALRPGTGTITGKVVEGPRIQPGLTVVLRDNDGNEKARTTTDKDGMYLFENVAPGRYSVFCSKPASRRQAASPAVSVRPDKETKVNLSLSL